MPSTHLEMERNEKMPNSQRATDERTRGRQIHKCTEGHEKERYTNTQIEGDERSKDTQI